MALLSDLGDGVAASLTAIGVVEAYRAGRIKLDRRPVRKLLGQPKRIGIVTPTYPDLRARSKFGVISSDNAFSLAHLIDACASIGSEAELCVAQHIPVNLPDNLLILGGHLANEITRSKLIRHCPGFEIRGGDADTEDPADPWYRCAGIDFKDTKDDAYAFVVKLAEGSKDSRRVTVLMWGRSSFGTSAAAYTFGVRTKLITDTVDAKKPFFLAFKFDKGLEYHAFPDEILDLTEKAFDLPSL